MQFRTATAFKLIILLFLFFPLSSRESQSCRQVIQKMMDAISKVKTAKYHLYSIERINDKILTANSDIKLMMSPRKIYFKNSLKGIEVLYVEGTLNGETLINPNSFPFVNLRLDPYKSIMRNNQHHTIFELGFAHIGKIIGTSIQKHQKDFDQTFFLLPDVEFNNRPCYKVFSEVKTFKYVPYTVQKGETARSIAEKFAIGEYRIFQNNPNLHYTDPIKAGRKLMIPNFYAEKTILYIDKLLMLPVYIKAFDDKGLYESYEFSHLEINPNISPAEFTKDYKGYKF
jgi:outer membrane lipoprotein-sorting protein